MEGPPGNMLRSTSDVRLAMFLHGNSVQTRSKRNTRSDDRSPLKGGAPSRGPGSVLD